MDTKIRSTELAFWREYRAWRMSLVRAGQDSPNGVNWVPFEVGDLIEVTLTSLYWVEGRKRREAGEVFLARPEGHVVQTRHKHNGIVSVYTQLPIIQAEDNGDRMYDNHYTAKFRLVEPI